MSAYDGDNAQSDSPITLEFNTELPKQKTYSLQKSGANSYKRPKVGNRIGVPHTVQLANSDNADDVVNYDFLDFITADKITDKIKSTDSAYTGTATRETDLCTDANAASASAVAGIVDQGEGCWTSTISGTEASIGTFAPAAPPTVTFMLGADRKLSDSGDVGITIRYWVVARAADAGATPPVTLSIVEVDRRIVNLDIHSCVEFSDCPRNKRLRWQG